MNEKDKPRLVYSTDRAQIVKLARAKGMSTEAILRQLVHAEYGKPKRRRIVSEWAPVLGLSEEDAVALATRLDLI